MSANIAVDTVSIILRDPDTGGEPLAAAINNLEARGIEVVMEAASGEVGALALAEKATARARQSSGACAIVAAGGDGTLNEVINGAFQPSPDYAYGVGVLPLGTANDFARQCRVPLDDPQGALDVIAAGRTAWIDLGRMNGRLYANLALGGFAAEVSSDTSPALKKLLGPTAYLVQGLASLAELAPRHLKIQSPERNWEGDALLLVIGNGGVSGSMATLSRCTLINDGLLDVCVLPDVPLTQAIAIADRVMRGSELGGEDGVVCFQTSWLDVESNNLQINLDGQPFAGDSFHFDAVPRAMPFFMPLDREKPDFLL